MAEKVTYKDQPDTRHVDDVGNSAHTPQELHGNERHIANITGVDSDQIDKSYWVSPRFLGSCAAIIFVANSLFFGYAVPVNILNVINEDLGPSTDISLVTLVNTLCQGVVNLLVGSISDVIGRRWFLIGGQVFGIVGAVLGGASRNISMLVGASVFTGIGAACQLTYPLLVMEIVPNKYRGWAQGLITLTVLPSLGFGPIVGRAIIESWGWRGTYWVSCIINGIGGILLFTFYFPPTFEDLQDRKSAWQQAKEIDYLGFILYAGSIICILLGLTWGGQQDPWSSGKIVALLTVGCVVLVGFFCYEAFMPLKSPLLPMNLFRIRNYVLAVIIGSIGQMSYYAFNVLWPTQASLLYTTDNLTLGWMGSTTGTALAIGEIIMGPFLKYGHVRLQQILACVGLCIFGGLMAMANEDRQSLAIACTAVSGFFIGWIELVAIVVAGLVVPPDEIGVAQTFFGSTRAVFGTVATSIYLAIYTGRLNTNLAGTVTRYAYDAGLPTSSTTDLLEALSNGTAAAYAAIPGSSVGIVSAITAGIERAHASSLSIVYLASLSFAGTALISSFFLTDISKYLTDFVNKKVDGNSARADHFEHKNMEHEV